MLEPMKPNPGGQLAPEEIVGRDLLIKYMYDILQHQSLVLTAERRIGKTKTLDKMRAMYTESLLFIYQDLEPIRTADDFAESVFQQAKPFLPGLAKAGDAVRRVLQQVKKIDFGGPNLELTVAALAWQHKLEITLAALASGDHLPVVVQWDELPLMLSNIADTEGEAKTMEVLDLLRAFRHKYPALRVIYTGSIGLHHVIKRLQRAGYANDPTNDMFLLEVPPLLEKDAVDLARALLAGAGIQSERPFPLARAIALAIDCFPYYIHYLVQEMEWEEGKVTEATVEKIVNRLLTHDQDPLHFHHYEERIDTYYPEADRPLVLAILDAFASVAESLTFAEAFNLVKARVATEDRDAIRHLLGQLRRDHYLHQMEDGRYSFRFGIVKRWWQLHRGEEVPA